jgi:hypothetical protein
MHQPAGRAALVQPLHTFVKLVDNRLLTGLAINDGVPRAERRVPGGRNGIAASP